MNTARIGPDDKGFDGLAFYRALEATVEIRGKTWRQVSVETGVSASTLARMSQNKKPDAASLAVLSAWAGINPTDFVDGPYKAIRPEPMVEISSLLRSDPSLGPSAATAIEAIIRAAYEQLRKS